MLRLSHRNHRDLFVRRRQIVGGLLQNLTQAITHDQTFTRLQTNRDNPQMRVSMSPGAGAGCRLVRRQRLILVSTRLYFYRGRVRNLLALYRDHHDFH
jgi:hypothetical protein